VGEVNWRDKTVPASLKGEREFSEIAEPGRPWFGEKERKEIGGNREKSAFNIQGRRIKPYLKG